MPRPATPVIIPPADAAKLRAIVTKGTHKSRKIARARALLAMGSGQGADAVHAQVGISTTQYYRLKRRYLAEGLAQALEARITSLACSDLPAGAARWTLSLLNENLVTLDYGPAVSRETIRQVLKKANSSLG